jgi:hypothetical protein
VWVRFPSPGALSPLLGLRVGQLTQDLFVRLPFGAAVLRDAHFLSPVVQFRTTLTGLLTCVGAASSSRNFWPSAETA